MPSVDCLVVEEKLHSYSVRAQDGAPCDHPRKMYVDGVCFAADKPEAGHNDWLRGLKMAQPLQGNRRNLRDREVPAIHRVDVLEF